MVFMYVIRFHKSALCQNSSLGFDFSGRVPEVRRNIRTLANFAFEV
jgi:hypothetical protein